MFEITVSSGCCCCVVAKSGPTLCNPMDCSPPGASVHEIFQARVLVVGCHFLLQGIFIGKFSWGWYTFFNFYKGTIHFLELVGTGFIVPSIYIIYFCIYFFMCVCYVLHLESASWDLEVILKLIFRDLGLLQEESVTLRIR